MTLANYQLSLNFEQILALVKQLPYPEKLQLSQELEKEVLNSKLTALLESFSTDELSLETITQEVEAVRSEIHARKTSH
ncbi:MULTISPECIES: type II toxin-antitoxin system VapB15 family antitoxin [unclassified Microcoleus]|uniref:type II toxin-antitoxin system VapB15 family antitoxin n=1 Tax=unclassified Microcoleus TaxID=2642155 RepID=UPI002FD22D10